MNESHVGLADDPERARASLDDEIHVWLARPDEITDPDRVAFFRSLLNEEELRREARFVTPRLRHLFLVSHALVRISLSRYAPVDPRSWDFCEAEFGRPEIDEPKLRPPLRFNLSHTMGLVACLVCGDFEAGVDVERVARVKDLEGVSRRVYSQPEIADIMALEGDEREGRFSDFWVLKEAYIKARGMGFQLPLRDITFRIEDREKPGLAFAPGFDDEAREWQLQLDCVGARYRLGVAARMGEDPRRKIMIRETHLERATA
jgi:4'-phosphopantetheinyl transferase